jgi:hyperosmotically inducible protein
MSQEQLAREIRHELIALPHYSIFDSLDFRLEQTRITLLGQVTSPRMKASAEAAVRALGVTSITDQIESLPVSPTDDELRLQLFRVLYSSPTLEKYAIQAVPPIHIIVKNGHVTLEGTIAAQSEKNEAEIEASALPGVVSLRNNLRIEKQAA